MSLGTQMRNARQIAGYTQDELAKGVGVSRNTISRWEHDKNIPSIDDIKKIASFLDIPINTFEESDCNEIDDKERYIASSIDELRLELMLERKLKNRYILLFSIGIIGIIVFFIIFIFIYFNLCEWRDPNTPEEPVRIVEYIYTENSTQFRNDIIG